MEGAVLAGKLAAEIVVDDALGEVQPSVYIYLTRRLYPLRVYLPNTVP